MTHDEAINVLKEHQLWRKGIPPYDKAGAFPYYTPHDLTAALDYAITELEACTLRGKNGDTNK